MTGPAPSARPARRVLMVTGAYHPEISSAGVQCRNMARLLAGRVNIHVLTTAVDPGLPRRERVDGVAVTRVFVDVGRAWSKLQATVRMVVEAVRLARRCDLVHIHGVSTKNVIVTIVAKLLRRRIVLSLHTAGYDEPEAIARQGRLALWAFRSADLYLSVSPGLVESYLAAGLPPGRLLQVPNGIDIDRFTPASAVERRAIRERLGWPAARRVVVFVGFFSPDKQPRVLYDAWVQLQSSGAIDATLVFVGATRSAYFEVDDRLADQMREDAARRGLGDHLAFTGATHEVPEYLRAADVFALPSRREGLPVALLEAMACGLPCVASRLPGSTDAIVEDGKNGILVPVGDVEALAGAMATVLRNAEYASALGTAARATITRRFGSADVADRWLDAYDRLPAATEPQA
jgi:glycosyltransferase involved in cell wall biosynthesis